MAKRKQYDHQAIGRVYRAGQLSDREVAAQFGCSHTYVQKLAKKYGWKKDLSSRVRKGVANKLVAKVANGNTDDEIVEAASRIGAEVVELHRQDIANLRVVEAKLIAELAGEPKKLYMTQYQGVIVEKEVGLTVAERAQAANNLANVQHKRIALERQAFNLDDGSGETDKPDSIRISLHRDEKRT
jgi:hypothetical protein